MQVLPIATLSTRWIRVFSIGVSFTNSSIPAVNVKFSLLIFRNFFAFSTASFCVSNVPDARSEPAFRMLHLFPFGTTCCPLRDLGPFATTLVMNLTLKSGSINSRCTTYSICKLLPFSIELNSVYILNKLETIIRMF